MERYLDCDEEPDSPRRRPGEIQEALEEVDRAIDKALRSHAYPRPGQAFLTADKAAEAAEWVRLQQADYNTLIANALGELAGLVLERGRS